MPTAPTRPRAGDVRDALKFGRHLGQLLKFRGGQQAFVRQHRCSGDEIGHWAVAGTISLLVNTKINKQVAVQI